MNKYRFYKKNKDFYFNFDELFFPLVPILLIVSLISYPIIYFLGFKVIVLLKVVLAAFVSMYYVGLKHASPNGSNNSSGSSFSLSKFIEIFIPFLLVCPFLLYLDYALYLLVVYQKTGTLNKLFWIMLFLLIGTPVCYYLFLFTQHYLLRLSQASRYMEVLFDVKYDTELMISIKELNFLSSKKKRAFDVKVKNRERFYEWKELLKKSIRDRNSDLHYTAFREMIYIPFETDRILISWYSLTEDKFFSAEIPFPYEKLVIEEVKYPLDVSKRLRGKMTKTLFLRLYLNGGVKLYNKDSVLIETTLQESLIADEEKKQRSNPYHYGIRGDITAIRNEIRNSGRIEKRALINTVKFNWCLSVEGLEEGHKIEIFDVSFSSYEKPAKELELASFNFLPRHIDFVHSNRNWLNLFFDLEKLYDSIILLLKDQKESVVHFHITTANRGENITIKIKVQNETILFEHWEKNIHEEYREYVYERINSRLEVLAKYALLDEGWALIRAEKYEAAQEKCTQLKSMDPTFGFAYFLEARVLWYQKGFEVAYEKRDYFIEKTSHDLPALGRIYNHIGCILDVEKRYEEALDYFVKSRALEPNDPNYSSNIAEMYYKMKKPKEALQYAEESTKKGGSFEILEVIKKTNGILA